MAQEGDPWTEARVEASHGTWERLGKRGTACSSWALGRPAPVQAMECPQGMGGEGKGWEPEFPSSLPSTGKEAKFPPTHTFFLFSVLGRYFQLLLFFLKKNPHAQACKCSQVIYKEREGGIDADLRRDRIPSFRLKALASLLDGGASIG